MIYMFDKGTGAEGQNLSKYLRPSDYNRKVDRTPKLRDCEAVRWYSRGKEKLTFTREQFESDISAILQLVHNQSKGSADKKAQIMFGWWLNRNAIVET